MLGVGTEVVHGDLATVRLDAAVGAEEAVWRWPISVNAVTV